MSIRSRSMTTLLMAAVIAFTSCATAATSPAAVKPPVFMLRRPVVYNSPVCLVNRTIIDTGKAPETFAAILIGAIAPKLIDLAVTKSTAALQKAAAAKVDTIAAKTAAYYYVYDRKANAEEGSVSLLANCVSFAVLDESATWTDFEKAMDENLKVKKGEIDGLRKVLGLADAKAPGPAFYYEAAIIPAEDVSAIQLRPAVLYYPKSLASAKQGEERTLTAVYTFKDLTGNAVATADITLPKVPVGTTLGPNSIRFVQSPWLPVVPMSNASKELVADEQTKKAKQVQQRVVKKLTPFNLEASVSETREAREWLKAIADVLASDEVKNATKSTFTDLLPKSEEDKTKATLSALTAAKDLELAKRDVSIACIALAAAATSADKASKERDVIEKQFAANEKAINAGQSKPFSTPDKPSCQ